MANRERPIDLAEVEKYAQLCDNEEEIALCLCISYDTLARRKKKYAEFAEAVKRGRTKANIAVAGKLLDKVKKGDTTAAIFWLKTRAKWTEAPREVKIGGMGDDAAPVRVDLSGVPLERLKQARELLSGETAADDPEGDGSDPD